MKLSVKFFSPFLISLFCASVSNSILAAQTDKPERWFEIEVVLFKQLGDKKVLKEQFPNDVDSTSLPQYKNHFNLFSAYLQPDLTGIKQFMPLCDESNAANNVPDNIVTILPKIDIPFSDTLHINEFINNAIEPQFTNKNDDSIPAVAAEFDLQDKFKEPLFSTQNICIITRNDFRDLLNDEQFANLDLDGVDVESLPTKFKALGEHISHTPYLIAEESLLLSDIKQRLQWSKEFKPLLHFGWRQIGVTRNKAIPLKLFAGEHLDYQYKQALSNYQSALDEMKLAEQLSSLQSADSEIATIEQNEASITKINQQKLTQVFSQFDKLENTTTEQLIDELNIQTLEMLLASNEVTIEQSTSLKTNKQPVEPLQPWFLDGFFKIHLDHYLYITADFNILTQSLEKNKSNTTNNLTHEPKVKLVNFSQNKRVITGEIHYFDHPYIGMVVQIRRFDPSKPKDEAVTQVIN